MNDVIIYGAVFGAGVIAGVIAGTLILAAMSRAMLEEAIRQYRKSLAAWHDVAQVRAAMLAELAAVREAATLTVGTRVN